MANIFLWVIILVITSGKPVDNCSKRANNKLIAGKLGLISASNNNQRCNGQPWESQSRIAQILMAANDCITKLIKRFTTKLMRSWARP